MAKSIIINGERYRSFDEIPPGVREHFQRMLSKFADRDLNGIPDIFEDDRIGDFVVADDYSIVINDNEYTGYEDLPPFIRDAFEKVIPYPDGSVEPTIELQMRAETSQPDDDHPSWLTDMKPLNRSNPVRDVHKPVTTGSRFISVAIALSLIAIGILLFLVFSSS